MLWLGALMPSCFGRSYSAIHILRCRIPPRAQDLAWKISWVVIIVRWRCDLCVYAECGQSGVAEMKMNHGMKGHKLLSNGFRRQVQTHWAWQLGQAKIRNKKWKCSEDHHRWKCSAVTHTRVMELSFGSADEAPHSLTHAGMIMSWISWCVMMPTCGNPVWKFHRIVTCRTNWVSTRVRRWHEQEMNESDIIVILDKIEINRCFDYFKI
jgi:hypothetical protein